jgi:hypothetical protein
MAPKMPEIPVFATEVRFYRDVLGVAYETGSRLRKLGVLTQARTVTTVARSIA